MGRVVGIDLGTTNSLVAYVQDGEPVVIRDKSGDGLYPRSSRCRRRPSTSVEKRNGGS